MPNVTEIRCKQALNKVNSQGLPQEWDLNLYRGCQHGCVYCFAMYSHEYLNPNGNYFDDLYVKVNIVEQLEKQLRSPNWKRETIAIAGVTDCYQPIEAKYKMMPEILKLLIKYQNPVVISTKSDLILRDFDLIDELSRVTDVAINSSIVTMDNEIRRKIEPVGRNAKEKFAMLKEFSKTNARTGLLQMPIIPYITDSRANIEDLYAHAADAKVDYVVPGMLYLRGKTRGVFFDFIKREFPELFTPLTKLYQTGGRTEYKRALYAMVGELRRKYRLQSWYALPPKPATSDLANIKRVADGFQQLSLFENNETTKTYSAVQITQKGDLQVTAAPETAPKRRVNFEQDLSSFVEIEMGDERPHATSMPLPMNAEIPLRTEQNEQKSMFYSLRQLGHYTTNFTNHAHIFYEQAMLMQGFTDDYAGITPLMAYFPCYQQLTDTQLRTYFTWRTQVRAGVINETSTSYAFLYIYELLNQIGSKNPTDGLAKLVTFWLAYREYDKIIDRYVLAWIKDYHVYYEVNQSFTDFVHAHNLVQHYPQIFCYDANFEPFFTISKYDITKSKFYTADHEPLITECFDYLLKQLRTQFSATNQLFEDLIFYPLPRNVIWTPFESAIFYHRNKHEKDFVTTPRAVELSIREHYTYQDGQWRHQTTMLSEHGKQLVGYLLKAMECSLREILKFKYKIKANYDIIDTKTLSRFNEVGITDLPAFISRTVQEFYAEKTRKIITVDLGNLGRIRDEALETQEKLIIPEDEQPVVIDAPVATKVDVTTDVSGQNNPWVELKNLLTMVEKEALKVVLSGGWLAKFAREKLVMLEVLVDGINDKAMDTVGDAILEVEEDVLVYEEYENDVLRLVD